MTVIHEPRTHVRCDARYHRDPMFGCPAKFWPAQDMSEADARAAAGRYGWRCTLTNGGKTLDVCSQCARDAARDGRAYV